MRRRKVFVTRVLAAATLASFLSAGTALAQKKLDTEAGWYEIADLSFVQTDGNSDVQTFSLDNDVHRVWERAVWQFKFGGLRSVSRDETTIAIDTVPTTFISTENKRVEAEKYYVTTEYGRTISKRVYWFSGLGWNRDLDAGIVNRYELFAGLGNIWIDRESQRFRTDYALSITDQEDEIDDPTTEDTFGGLRLSLTYQKTFAGNSIFDSEVIGNGNANDSENYRANIFNALTVNMNKTLALKVSLRWLYQNLPTLDSVPLFAGPGPPAPGEAPIGTALVRRDELDTIFKVGLVVNWDSNRRRNKAAASQAEAP